MENANVFKGSAMLIRKIDSNRSLLPDNCQEVIGIIGTEPFLELCRVYGGTQIYIPMLSSVWHMLRKAQIDPEEFKCYSLQELSKKYNCSLSTLYRMKREFRRDSSYVDGKMES